MRTRWGVLISGNGSTLQSLLDARDLCDIAVVIASKASAYGILRARRAGVPVEIWPASLKGPSQKDAAEKWLVEVLEKYRAEKIFLAGYMKIVSGTFIKKYEGRIFNVHPSLLPAYKGLDALNEALKSGEAHAGVTIHHVAEEVDSGRHVFQRQFDIPAHRDAGLSHLWLHINEQRLIRDTVKRILWQERRMS